jgi:hypothetical protein
MCLALSASAEAAIVVGQTASPLNPPFECPFVNPADELQLSVASGTSYTVPTTGTITSWSTFAGGGPSQSMTLKVFRKVGPFSYLVVAKSTASLLPNTLNKTLVEIPVQAGDHIGEEVFGRETESPCNFATGESSDRVLFVDNSSVAPGGTVVFPGRVEPEVRLNISATVQPPPTITSINPTSGSFKGGTKVTIAGANLEGASVSFGGFTIPQVQQDSGSQITATTPPTPGPTSTQISVKTVAGTAISAQPFVTTACVVPRLKGANLSAVRRKLRKADCKLGAVTKLKGATVGTGKVVKQNPRPGAKLAPGSKVSVKLGAGALARH